MNSTLLPRAILLAPLLVAPFSLPAAELDFYRQTETFLINHFSNPKNFREAQANEPNPLLLAVDRNYTRLARSLIESGTDVNLRNQDGISPLLWAVTTNKNRLTEILLSYHASPNNPDNKRWTPLMIAAQNNNLRLVKALIEAGADINATNFEGSSAFLWASRNGSLPLLRYLYEEGAEIGHRNLKNQTAVHVATQYGQVEVLRYLLAQDSSLALDRDVEGETPLIKAVQNGRYNMVDILAPYELGGSPESPLSAAIALATLQGNNEMVAYLQRFLTPLPRRQAGEKSTPQATLPVATNMRNLGQVEEFKSLSSLPGDVRTRILTFLGILDPTSVRTVQVKKKVDATGDLWSGNVSYSENNETKSQSFDLRVRR